MQTRRACSGAFAMREPPFLRCVGVALLVSLAFGCAPPPPSLQVGKPIEIEKRGLGVRYEQGGKAIHRVDMVQQLRTQPSSSREMSNHQNWLTGTMIVAGVGGAFVGWPIGQAIGGDPEPLWVLAAVGGGVIALSIPMGVVADKKLKKGVLAYNEGLQGSPSGEAETTGRILIAPVAGGSSLAFEGSF